MCVKEIWRYPVKSMAGERLKHAAVGPLGIEGDRTVIVTRKGRIVTARKDYKLLGLKATIDSEGITRISGHPWDSPAALALVHNNVGPDAELVRFDGPERFDILPLLIATDGAIKRMGFDGRRLRPNIVIGGVHDLDERSWPRSQIRIGSIVVYAAQLRGRCIMTTYDPDTLEQDRSVLRNIGRELGGHMALDSAVIQGGILEEGAPVVLEPVPALSTI